MDKTKETSKIKSCEFCGEDFIYKQKTQRFCNREHFKRCEVCNENFLVKNPASNPRTCSRKCRSKLIYIEKDKNPNIVKKCQLCGEEFTTGNNRQKYCNKKHFKKCEVCGKSFLIKKLHAPPRTCSQSCGSSLTHNESSKEIRRINSLKKYGTEHPFQAESVKNKIKKSLDNSENDFRIGSKRFKSYIEEKYGVDNVSQLQFVKEKKVESYRNKYGVDNPMQSDKIQKLRRESMIEQYGTDNKKYVDVLNRNDFMNLYDFLSVNKMNVEELCEYFQVKRDKMLREIKEQDVALLVEDYGEITSLKEHKFKNFLKNKFQNVNVIINDRTVLEGKELDFYFPSERLAVEISPTSTHNSKVGYNNGPGLPSSYHKDKFLSCANKGIELITIFDWHDWDKVLEMISNKLNSSKRIFARKTEYVEEDRISNETFNMLSDWHILSLPSNFKRKNPVSKLIYNDEIVGLALWVTSNNETELKRMVFKPGINVVGGASKLIKNFMRNNNVSEVVTFSDCDLGQGNVYSSIGFELEEESKPQLNYYNSYYNYHIRNLSLVKQGADRLLSNFPNYEPVGMGEGLPSNQEIVESYGFLPVYDCGYRKWRLKL